MQFNLISLSETTSRILLHKAGKLISLKERIHTATPGKQRPCLQCGMPCTGEIIERGDNLRSVRNGDSSKNIRYTCLIISPCHYS
jgi:hypothetical protein